MRKPDADRGPRLGQQADELRRRRRLEGVLPLQLGGEAALLQPPLGAGQEVGHALGEERAAVARVGAPERGEERSAAGRDDEHLVAR